MIIAISILAILASLFAVMLKEKTPEISMLVNIAAGTIILLMIITQIVPILAQIKELYELSAIESENIAVLFKALGICFITQFCSDSCLDCGQKAMSSKVQLAGKVSITVLALPLLKEVLQTVLSIIGN